MKDKQENFDEIIHDSEIDYRNQKRTRRKKILIIFGIDVLLLIYLVYELIFLFYNLK